MTEKNIICNYTTLLPVIENYKKSNILIGGIHHESKILDYWGIKNYITFDEYAALYPFLVPISKRSTTD